MDGCYQIDFYFSSNLPKGANDMPGDIRLPSYTRNKRHTLQGSRRPAVEK